MIVLDTNVISALMLPHFNRPVIAWLNPQSNNQIWTTSISVLEARFGILVLPDGKRKDRLAAAFSALLNDVLGARVLPFDTAAADAAAIVSSARMAVGINKKTLDTQIAGIVRSRNATLATRNIKDFDDLDIPLINPWED